VQAEQVLTPAFSSHHVGSHVLAAWIVQQEAHSNNKQLPPLIRNQVPVKAAEAAAHACFAPQAQRPQHFQPLSLLQRCYVPSDNAREHGLEERM